MMCHSVPNTKHCITCIIYNYRYPVNMFCCVCIIQIVLLMCGRLYWQINLTETETV